jgi:hypothetical protein
MSVSYASPGVYVEELDKGTKPIEAAGTSTAGFVGVTLEASVKKLNPDTGVREPISSVLNQPVLVTNWTQFTDVFGGITSEAYLPDAVYGYFANGGGPCYVTSIRAISDSDVKTASVTIPASKGTSFVVSAKLPGASANGLVVKIETADDKKSFKMTVDGQSKSGLSLKKGDSIDDFDTVVISEVSGSAPADGEYTLTGGGMAALVEADFIGDVAARTGISGLEAMEDVRLVACPDIMLGYDGSKEAKMRVKAIQTSIIVHCESLRYRFAILDTPPGLSAQEAKQWREFVNFDTSYAAMYYPWIEIADLAGSGTKLVPPSGYMTGVYNRTDAERGVHKAPANEVVGGAVSLEINLTKGEQDTLNPIGLNCIRSFPGRGIRVWGARTLSNDGSWRYINVRRLFIMIGASLEAGLNWAVFEPNDHTLWAKVRRDVNSFLRTVWRSGALFGTTPDQSFYVKCDEELNPTEIRDLGQLIIEVGVAPVKPAEFVILRLSQWAGPNAE